MKSLIQFFSILSILLVSSSVFAQAKKEIRKEVKMEEHNGEKQLTIVTNENGKVTEEIYKGEAADKKLAEMNQAESMKKEVREEVKVEMVNGEKVMTIRRIENGNETIEVIKGDEVDQRMKAMEVEPAEGQQIKMKKVEKQENKEHKRSN